MSAKGKNWIQTFEKNGITVFKREKENSEFYEFKGVVVAKASLSAFTALMLDAPNMASWMHKTEEVKLLEQVADNERIAYMRFDFMPVGKRELIVRNRITQDPEDLAVTYSMERITDHPAVKKSRHGMIQGITGFVRAVPFSAERIEITYQCHVEPGIKLLELWGASVLTNKLLSDTPYYTLRQAARHLASSKYQGEAIEFIKEPGEILAC